MFLRSLQGNTQSHGTERQTLLPVFLVTTNTHSTFPLSSKTKQNKKTWKPWSWYKTAKVIPCPVFFPWNSPGLVSHVVRAWRFAWKPVCPQLLKVSVLLVTDGSANSATTVAFISVPVGQVGLFVSDGPPLETWNVSLWAAGEQWVQWSFSPKYAPWTCKRSSP